MDGVKAAAVRALEQQQVPARISMATTIVSLASSAKPVAVAIMAFAPALVRRLLVAT